jgi:hypothetical protein
MMVATSLAALFLAVSSTPAEARKPPATRAPAVRGGAFTDAGARSPGAASASMTTSSSDRGAADVVESRTLDGGTHVFKFSELDIEGRLKSPQLVYFLRRVRAEFAAGELGHRSFLREMSETRRGSSF